jgi:hypothetical protein
VALFENGKLLINVELKVNRYFVTSRVVTEEIRTVYRRQELGLTELLSELQTVES